MANGGPNGQLNCVTSSVTLQGSSNITSGVTYAWTNEAGDTLSQNLTLTVLEAGSYYFEVFNVANNCFSGKDEVIVVEDYTLPDATINAEPDSLINCIIATVDLFGNIQENVIFNWTYVETFIENRDRITLSEAALVEMTAIDTLNGCTNSNTINILDFENYPDIVAQPITPITCTETTTVIDLTGSQFTQHVIYNWYFDNQLLNQSTIQINVNTPGSYIVEAIDTLNGCSNRDTFLVDRIGEFPIVTTSDDKTLYCGETATTVGVTIVNPTSSTTIQWSSTGGGQIVNGQGTENISVNGAGTYLASVTYDISGCTTTENITVTVNNDIPNNAIIETEDESCINESDGFAELRSIEGGAAPYTVTLNGVPIDINVPNTNLAPGTYALDIIDANGCSYQTSFTILPGNDFDIISIGSIELEAGKSQTVTINTDLPLNDIASVQWIPTEYVSCDTCLTTTLTGIDNITYTVIVTDVNGCQAQTTITVRVRFVSDIVIPNIIKPNSGFNKGLTVFGNINVLNVKKLSVYDRWGNLIFEKSNFPPNDINLGWNGTFNGRPVEQGVYVYLAEVETREGTEVLAGDVTVVR